MARLLVDAVSFDYRPFSPPDSSNPPVTPRRILVSVIRADTGAPVTGLVLDNFRTSSYSGSDQLHLRAVNALKWGPENTVSSGGYDLEVQLRREGVLVEWPEGALFEFVLGVRVRDRSGDEDPDGPRTERRGGGIGHAGEREFGTVADRPELGQAERPKMALFHQGQAIVRMETL